jgi:hypothetical protein
VGKLGEVGLMEAQRRRDEFVVKMRHEPTPPRSTRTTVAEAAAEWLGDQQHRVSIGDLRQRTLDIYEEGLRLHVMPELGPRPVRSITPDDLVAWHRLRQGKASPPTRYTRGGHHSGWSSRTLSGAD